VNDETAVIRKGNVVPVLLNEAHTFRNTGSQDLKFMVVGIASKKGVLETELGRCGEGGSSFKYGAQTVR